MSLTVLLKNPLGKEFRERLSAEFPSPKFEMPKIKPIPLTKEYAIAGAAFDYLLKFTIERNTSKDCLDKTAFPFILDPSSIFKGMNSNKATHILSGNGERKYEKSELIITLEILYEQAIKEYKMYIKTGKVNGVIISTCIFLAKLLLFRGWRYLHEEIECAEDETVGDVWDMFNLVDISKFKTKKKCYLNPGMGMGSPIGESVGDIIIDDTLIDIKATVKDKIKREDFNQLLGYYLLHLISGVNKVGGEKPIKKIGIYFARHGFLWTIPIKNIGTKEQFEDLKNWFIKYPPLTNTEAALSK